MRPPRGNRKLRPNEKPELPASSRADSTSNWFVDDNATGKYLPQDWSYMATGEPRHPWYLGHRLQTLIANQCAGYTGAQDRNHHAVLWSVYLPGLQWFRRLVTRNEYHIKNYLGMVRLGCMRIIVSDYSYRSATMGSTFAARRAGT